MADFGIVDAAVAHEGGSAGITGVDSPKATADETEECAGHAGEEKDEWEGCCGFH